MSWLANIRVRIEEWWSNYQRDVAVARKRQRMLRLIRDKSYAHEKGIQDAKTAGHRARQPKEPPREYSNSLFGPTESGKSVDPVGNVDDIFKVFKDEEE